VERSVVGEEETSMTGEEGKWTGRCVERIVRDRRVLGEQQVSGERRAGREGQLRVERRAGAG
jgi:hypothetical protein